MSYSTPIKKRKVYHTSLSCSELSSFLDSLIQFKYIPNCLHALGFLVQSDINKDAVNSLFVETFPDYFGEYKNSNAKKSFRRVQYEVKSRKSKHSLLVEAALEKFIRSDESHRNQSSFEKSTICSLCFPLTFHL